MNSFNWMRGRTIIMRVLPVFLFLALSWSGSILIAQEQEGATEDEESSGVNVTIHGYLTQAYAQSDGHNFLGITKEGTADYRTAALQVRADIRTNDTFVVQFSHERLGESGLQPLKDDVELDWIFYEHRFGNSAVKVGRVQIPWGIYNEVRDVGVVLPFYRPSHNFYGEAAYSSETVDGIVLSHSFDLPGNWGIDADVHYGEWDFVSREFNSTNFVNNHVNDSIGAELWLNTALSGLRVGTGYMKYDINFAGTPQSWNVYHVSLAGDFERFAFHSEFKDVDIGNGFHSTFDNFHLGVNITDSITANVFQDRFFSKFGKDFRRLKLDQDRVAGLNYRFNPSLLLKAEHHWDEGSFWAEDEPQYGASTKTRFWILSLSTAF